MTAEPRVIRLTDLPPEMRKAVARMANRPAGMNRTESRRADALEVLLRTGEIAAYRYEPLNLRLGANLYFRPDFLVIDAAGGVVFEDVKGRKGESYYATEDSAVKIKAAASQYPWFTFRIAWEAKGGVWRTKTIDAA